MASRALIDNWTLQNAGELLCSGLTGETADDLLLCEDGESFQYNEISADVLRLETLCQLLHSVVFADELFVDDQFTGSWSEFTPLRALRDNCILIAKPLKQAIDHWVERREAMAEELCGGPALRELHAQNKLSFAATGRSVDELAAQLIWGGAGMLARAEFLGIPYVPHPARQRLFSRAGFLRGPTAAEEQLSDFIQSERLKVYGFADDSGFLASLRLPPVALDVFERSKTITDVVNVAIQLRAEYKELRGWLAAFQQALDQEKLSEILKFRELLQNVAQNINSRLSPTVLGDTTVQLGFSWLKIATKVGSPLNWSRNRFGIRAQLNKLIIAPAGRNSVKTFLRLIGEENSRRGQLLEREFLRRAKAF